MHTAMNIPPFSHQPLARDCHSIRLVQVSPDLSPDGLIQCRISHNIIDETLTYTCLSYVWGKPELAQVILLNGRAFSVRQNLFNFLSLTQTKMATKTMELTAYWIDALCIDQGNVLERNHQVGQMGKIFSLAVCVHIWLGKISYEMEVFDILQNPSKVSMGDVRSLRNIKDYLEANIVKNAYWTRAWVTQEVLLAQKVLVILDVKMIPLSTLVYGLDYFWLLRDGPLINSGLFARNMNEPPLRRSSDFLSWNLVSMATHFRQRECSIPRDHFYSLFSLCKVNPEFTVDYDSSACEMAYQVLHHGMGRPCLCSTVFVLETLRAKDELQADLQRGRAVGPFVQFECTELMVERSHRVGNHKHRNQSRNGIQKGEQPSTVNHQGLGRSDPNTSMDWIRDACICGPARDRRYRKGSSRHPRWLRSFEGTIGQNSIPGSWPRHETYDDSLTEGSTTLTEYVRGEGFSARYNEKQDTHTIRIAFWALVTWLHRNGNKGIDLCKQDRPNQVARINADGVVVYEPNSDLEMRVGNGPWDLEADQSEVA